MSDQATFTAFAGHRRIATGPVEDTVRIVKELLDAGASDPVLIFEDQTGVQIDFDWRGTPDEVVARLARHPHLAPAAVPPARRAGPGRPKLGVVGREVSLLPRHWQWLSEQPGGASAALRRLVDDARKRTAGAGETRRTREAASRFLWAMAGNLPNFEEASRALFAGDGERLSSLIGNWPHDVRTHLEELLTATSRDASD